MAWVSFYAIAFDTIRTCDRRQAEPDGNFRVADHPDSVRAPFFETSSLLLASKIELRKTFRFKELSMPEPKANILVVFYSRDGP
jgi:hypothetical protein